MASSEKKSFDYKGAAFLFTVSGMSIIGGFSYAIASSRKTDPRMFDQGFHNAVKVHESASVLAVRALKWGSFYAITGVSLFCFGIWKLSGASNMREFKDKMTHLVPKVPKNEPQGRTEFENLTDLLQYVINEDKNSKNQPIDKEPVR